MNYARESLFPSIPMPAATAAAAAAAGGRLHFFFMQRKPFDELLFFFFPVSIFLKTKGGTHSIPFSPSGRWNNNNACIVHMLLILGERPDAERA